jgi:glycosyltransferase involved in cell wall biosynthesis
VVLHLTTTDISLELLLGPQLSAFIDAGYDVHAASAPGPFVDAIEARGVTFHPLEHSTRSMALTSDLRAAREVYRLFRRLRPDIVHTHNPKPGVYGRIGARLARVRAVVNTVHGLYAQPTDPLRRRLAVYALERVAAAFSHAELVQNPEDVATLQRLRVRADRVAVLGNGIDLDRFGPLAPDERAERRAALGFDPDDVVVGAVGRLVREKGYPELLEAAALVQRVAPAARFVVIGPHEPDKADAVTAEDVATAEAAGVTFLGHRDDVEALYGAMDVYVLASHREGFPRSAMEAAASGLPLVLTDIRGCRQVVDDGVTGALVPVEDAPELARAITALVQDTDLRVEQGAAGLAKAAAEFNQQRVIEITLETYQRLLER